MEKRLIRMIVFLVCISLCSCEDIETKKPPPGCFSMIFVINRKAKEREIEEVENNARDVPGETPHGEVSFEMAKPLIGGLTIYRSTKKRTVDPDEAYREVLSRIKRDHLEDIVEVRLIK
jgi:hypothetical protein